MESGLRVCKICKIEKPIDDYHTCGKYKSSYCKPCQNTFAREWRIKNWEEVARKKSRRYSLMTFEQKRRSKLISRYKIDLDTFNRMEVEQNHVCKICKMKCDSKKYLSVDHCHETKVVRGLLCNRCNNILGMARDNTEVLQSAIRYLEDFMVAK